jgi:hypothetical protein
MMLGVYAAGSSQRHCEEIALATNLLPGVRLFAFLSLYRRYHTVCEKAAG